MEGERGIRKRKGDSVGGENEGRRKEGGKKEGEVKGKEKETMEGEERRREAAPPHSTRTSTVG